MTTVSGTIRVAAVHAAAPFLDLHAGVARVIEYIHEAAAGGATLVAFPETFLPGYPHWIWSHTSKYSAPLFTALYQNAIEFPSPEATAIAQAADDAGVWVALGVDERDGGTLYNTMAWFSPAGKLVAKHRKLQPTNAERTVWGRGDGRDVFVVDAGFAKLGGLICGEHTMDLSRYALAALGEQIHIASWPAINATPADPMSPLFDDYSITLSAAHAIAAQTFVVVVQGSVSQEIIDRLGVPEGPDAPTLGGGITGVLGPDGRWLSEPHRDGEAVVFEDLDLSKLAFAKFYSDSGGHYARPDVFAFGVNRTAQMPLPAESLAALTEFSERSDADASVLKI